MPPTIWTRRRSSMASSCMLASCSRLAALTSLASKASWVPSAQTPLFPTTHHTTPLKTSPGGSMPSAPPEFTDSSLAQPLSLTEMPPQTPALVLASALLLATSGVPGISSRGGNQMVGILDGLKPLASSFLSALSAQPASQASSSGSLEIIEGSSKAGGKGGAETGRQTRSSVASITSQILTNALLLHATSPAEKTQQMRPQEDSTHLLLTSSQLSAFQTLSGNLSQMSTSSNQPPVESSPSVEAPTTPNSCFTQVTSRVRNGITTVDTPRLAVPLRTRSSRPSAYSPNLSPQPSPLRPHCLARDRIRLWRPSPDVRSRHSLPQEDDINQVFEVMSNAWLESTRESYSTGILVYHVYCDMRGIPEELRAPTNQHIITSFITSLAGSYSGAAIHNYIHGIRAWHILHGMEWRPNQLELEAVLKGADRLTPLSSKRKKRLPYTPEFIAKLRQHMKLDDPFDAAVFACLTTCFYAAARVGEFVVPRLDAFSAAQHITPANLRVDRNSEGLEVTILHVPHTKAAPLEGEDVFWSSHPGLTDPYSALENHMRVNNPPNDAHLFAYKYKSQLRPLTKHAFIKRLASVARLAGVEPLQGHGIRIGATLFYLLLGLPMEAMKVMGRWSSDAFLRYLKKHAQILTPLIQANPRVHEAFSQFIIPAQSILQGRR